MQSDRKVTMAFDGGLPSLLTRQESRKRKRTVMLDMPIAVKLSILILVVSTAITVNLLLIAAFLRNHLLRTLSTYFVFSLAICDLLFSSVVMSLSVSGIASHQESSAGIPCGLTAHLSCSLSLISVEMLTLMAINRYFKSRKDTRICLPTSPLSYLFP